MKRTFWISVPPSPSNSSSKASTSTSNTPSHPTPTTTTKRVLEDIDLNEPELDQPQPTTKKQKKEKYPNSVICHQDHQWHPITQDSLLYCKSLKPPTKSGKQVQCPRVYCGKCLERRYGENWEEVDKDDWSCPGCRGICNCSTCRRKPNQEPPGNLDQIAKKQGLANAAQVLIQDPDARQQYKTKLSLKDDDDDTIPQPFAFPFPKATASKATTSKATTSNPTEKPAEPKEVKTKAHKPPKERKPAKESKPAKEPKVKEPKVKVPKPKAVSTKTKKSLLPLPLPASPAYSVSSLSSLSPSPTPEPPAPKFIPGPQLTSLIYAPPLTALALREFTIRFLPPTYEWNFKKDFAQRKSLKGLLGMVDGGMKVSLVERIEDAARGLEESGGDRITWGEVEGVLREIGWKDDREGEEKWEWEEEEGRGGRTRGAKERVGEKRRVEIALGLVERLLAGNKVRDGILEGLEREKESSSVSYQERIRIRNELGVFKDDCRVKVEEEKDEKVKKALRKETLEKIRIKNAETELALKEILHERHLVITSTRPRFEPVATDIKNRQYYIPTPEQSCSIPTDYNDRDWWNRLGWEVLIYGIPFPTGSPDGDGTDVEGDTKMKVDDKEEKEQEPEWFSVHTSENIEKILNHLSYLYKVEGGSSGELVGWLKSFQAFVEVEMVRGKGKGKGKAVA